MDSIVGKVMRPFAAVWRVIALTLVICATGGAWAALHSVGDQLTFSSIEAVSSATTQDGASGVSQYYVTIPASADLPSGSKVTLQSIKLGRRSATRNYLVLSQAANAAMASTNRTDNSSTDASFGNKQWVRYDFNDLELTVGTQYPAYFRDANTGAATGNGESVYLMQISNISDYQVFAQNSYPATRIMYYEVKCTVKEVSLPTATPSVDGSNNCTFTITEDSKYEVASSTTYNTITFDIAAGKTLVLSGSTLTGTNGITVTGDGVVEFSYASALSGTLTGGGTVAYKGVKPTGLTYSNASWTGTVWLKGVTGIDSSFNFDNYSNSGSKTKVSGMTGWLNAQITYSNEVILDDDTYGFALKLTDGNSPQSSNQSSGKNVNRCAIFKKLSGSGTLTAGGDGSNVNAWPVVKLYDISEFTGNIDCGSSGTRIGVVICNEDEELPDTLFALFNPNPRRIYISAGRTSASAVSIPAGATWSALNGIAVAEGGALNLAGGTICNTLYGSATVTAASTASSLTVANGSRLTVNAALSGSVTVADGGTVDVASASTAGFTVQSGGTLSTAAEISGAINLTGTMNVYATGTLQFSSGSSIIQQDGVLNVVAGIAHMNVADRGIKGTINIQNGATFKSWGNDRLNYSASAVGGIVNVRQGGTLDMANTRWTMCKWNQINLYESATVTGTGDNNGASIDMNVGSGGDDVTIHALGTATINAPVKSAAHNYGVFNVDEGKTLTFSGRLFTNKTTKKGLGTLKLTYANGNTGTTTGADGNTYTVPTLSEGTIEFAGEGNWSLAIGESRDLSGYAYSGTGSIAVSAMQTGAECALGSDIIFENVASASLVPMVTLRTGGTVTPVLDGTTATSAGTGTVSIDGGAADLDLTCTNTIEFAYASFTGASTWRDVAPVYTEDGVYARARVYTDGAETFLANNSAALTLAVVGQMSSTANTIFLTLGNSYSTGTGSGLVIARTSEPDEVTIGYNDGRVVHKITNMTVPNCATSRHSYIITKQDGETTTTFTVYLDGIKWKTLSIAKLTLTGGGVQIGADFGGGIRSVAQSDYDGAAFITIPNSESETGVLNVMRMYGRIITPDEIAAYATTYPYVSPNGSSTRMFTSSAENWIDTTAASEVWMNSTDGNSGSPTVGANVTVVAQADTVITVNLESATEYEGLTVNESSVRFVPASASSGAIKITGMTVIGSAVTNAYGAVDMTGGPMTITEDGSICFDMSGYDASAVYTTTDVDLTGDVDAAPAKVSLISPVTLYRTYALVYTDDHYVMRITPISNPGGEVYYTGGYWSSAESSFAVTNASGDATIVFPGDTVVIPSYLTGDRASDCYIGDPLPANVATIRVEKASYTFKSGVDVPILGGVTVIVPATTTLTFANTQWHNVTLAAVTLAGAGTVSLPSLQSSVGVSETWTGTVILPSLAADGLILDNYGRAGSTIALTGITSGYLDPSHTVVDAALRLDGNVSITAMSVREYSFAKISGTGNLSLATTGDQPTSVTITEVAEGYSGAISSTLTTPVTITTLAREARTSTAYGTKLLTISGNVKANGLTIGGETSNTPIRTRTDGIYVVAGTIFSVY